MGAAQAVAAAPDGTVYFADYPFAQVKKIAPNGAVSVAAGSGYTIVSGDGGPAAAAAIGPGLNAVSLAPNGNLFLASIGTYRIREVTPDGTINTVIGSGRNGAPLHDVTAIAVDASGVVYYSDSLGLDRYFSGTSTVVYSSAPLSIAVSPSGVPHFLLNQSVYRLDGTDATLVAGTSTPKPGLINDGLPATQAFLPFPRAIAFDPAGNLYIGGQVTAGGPGAVWRVGSDGIQRRIAGPASGPASPDGTPAASAALIRRSGSRWMRPATSSSAPATNSRCWCRTAAPGAVSRPLPILLPCPPPAAVSTSGSRRRRTCAPMPSRRRQLG